jgi:hypothetical protein
MEEERQTDVDCNETPEHQQRDSALGQSLLHFTDAWTEQPRETCRRKKK